jgi:hypothetical protein
LSTLITPRPGLVWFSVIVRVRPSGDVIVTGGKVVASVRRVTSKRLPTRSARSRGVFSPPMLALCCHAGRGDAT